MDKVRGVATETVRRDFVKYPVVLIEFADGNELVYVALSPKHQDRLSDALNEVSRS